MGEDTPPRDEKAFKEQIKRARSRLPAVKEAPQPLPARHRTSL